MTKKQMNEIHEAMKAEFNDLYSDNDLDAAFREMNEFVGRMEKAGFTRMEAIVFLANSCRPR